MNETDVIIIGAGICHWYHADVTYRAIMALLMLTGCIGRNGGGWAHYVGQEKIRPIMGFQHMAFALDWHRPPRHMNQTAYWYVNTSQYRYDTFTADELGAGEAGGVRVDTGVAEGGEIPMYYDSMIAKLIVHGTDRADAIRRMRAAMDAA